MTQETPKMLSLKAKHQALDEQLLAEEARPQPDTSRIRQLKKQKLKLKEEIEQLKKKP